MRNTIPTPKEAKFATLASAIFSLFTWLAFLMIGQWASLIVPGWLALSYVAVWAKEKWRL